MFTPLIFDPTKVDLQALDDFQSSNPDSPSGIRVHVADGDVKTGKHRKRDFSVFISAEEIDQIQSHGSLSTEEFYDVAIQLMVRAAMVIEGFDSMTATRIVMLIIKPAIATEYIETVFNNRRATDEKLDDLTKLLRVASDLYDLVDTELYVQSMRLNLEDFYSIFPSRSCLHDPKLVLKKLVDSKYAVTDSERLKHFKDNRSMSFGIIGCMSMYDVRENTIDPEMRILLNAGRYQTQKNVYDSAALAEESKPSVVLKDELDGAIV